MSSSVQQALADYRGDDVWADVILRLEGYDEAATALLEPVCEVPIFVCAGTAYQWCAELGVGRRSTRRPKLAWR